MSVAEIESAIVQLLPHEAAALMAWFQEYHEKIWDKQIEDDLAAGRLDKLLAEIDKEHAAGLSQPL